MDEGQAAANAVLLVFMDRLASLLRTSFPLHSAALRSEVVGTRLTTDRWHRVASVLASLYAVPGFPLGSAEHDARNIALAAVVVAQKMAAASFGGRDPAGCRDLALWRANELSGRMLPPRNEGKANV